MSAIEINNLALTYNSRCVLHHFNATIEHGEFIGIFGPNGAGKSSLLKAVLGLHPPAKGNISVLGQPARRGNQHIGYVAQTHPNVATSRLSGRAQLAAVFHGYRWGLPFLNKQQRTEIEELLNLVHAQEYADRPFTDISGGERQRLFLAQALLNRPKILLLDEPLLNLDPCAQENLIELVHKIQIELKVTVLFTAHDLNPLLRVMDRIIYLAEGNAAIGEVKDIVTSEKLTSLYGTPIDVIQHDQQLFVISRDRGTEYATHHHLHADDV